MKINKLLLFHIITVASFFSPYLSVYASQWGTGNMHGQVMFFGEINAHTSSVPWEWKTGGYTHFHNTVSEMTSGTLLMLNVPQDILLLAARSVSAFEGGGPGAGIVPASQYRFNGQQKVVEKGHWYSL